MSFSFLFPKPIPVIGLTGEYASGKTLFGLTIAPGKDTLVYDCEKSSASYEDLGFVRRDVPTIMLERTGGRGYRPVDTFQWWRNEVATIPPGKFKVIGVDPISEIEAGLYDYVHAHPGEFGRTLAQYNRSSALVWGDSKELWKQILADLASRCEVFYFIVHLRREWAGNAPTLKKSPKGKSTLEELASLYLWMERKPNARGEVPAMPSAIVRKSRLVHTSFGADGVRMVPALPPRLPVATPAAIREYLLNPPDPGNLKPEECAPEEKLSDDDKLELRAQIAAHEAERARADLEIIAREGQTPPPPPTPSAVADAPGVAFPPDEPAPIVAEAPRPAPSAEPAPTGPTGGVMDAYCPPVDEKRLGIIADLRNRLFTLFPPPNPAQAWADILGRRGVDSATKLNAGQADELIDTLAGVLRESGADASF